MTGDPLAPAPATAARDHTKLAMLGLLAVTAVWGSTFFLIKDLLLRMPVPDFLAIRFAIAAVVLALIVPRAVLRLSVAARWRGLVLGLLYGVAQILQTAGLAHTAASVSGFVTGMYVVMTPLFAAVLLRHRVRLPAWVAVLLATAGLGLLALRGFSFGYGELLTLASAALYALHIVGLGAWSSGKDALGLAVVQMAVIAMVCGVAAVPGGFVLPAGPGDWMSVVYMALVAGAFALVMQTWSQAHLPPTRAAIVMCMEPVWAAVFAVLFGGESVTLRLLAGGGLILAAMYVTELTPSRGRTGDVAGRSPDGESGR